MTSPSSAGSDSSDMSEKDGPSQTQPQNKANNDEFARPYQIELLNQVRKKNSIICMGTGTGKTYIAIMLIKHFSYQTTTLVREGGKRTFFLVNQTALARQQGEALRKHLDLTVGTYIGADGVDEWHQNPERWEKEFNKNQVLVMTAQILLDILHHGILEFENINVLILDECHHSKKRSPYAQIMDAGMRTATKENMPRVLGLTASILNQSFRKAEVLDDCIKSLEKTLYSTAVTSSDFVAMAKYGTKPNEELLKCEGSEDETGLLAKMNAILTDGLCFLGLCANAYKRYNNDLEVQLKNSLDGNMKMAKPASLTLSLQALENCLCLLHELGPWAAATAASSFIKQLKKGEDNPRAPVKVNTNIFSLAINILGQLREIFDDYFRENIVDIDGVYTLVSPKVEKFVKDILYSYKTTNNLECCLTGIVFIERRNSAFILHKLIETLTTWDENLNFVKSAYMIGGGSKGETLESKSFIDNQEQNLRKFRKKEVNILISTSVLREGIDVPKCNLVVLFDVPKTYPEYIQAKGRARAANSNFFVLASSYEFENAETTVNEFKPYEAIIAAKCIDRKDITEDFDGNPDDELPPYMPKVPDGRAQPQVTMSSAVNLVNQYCSLLPGDRFSRMIPCYDIQEVRDEYEGGNRTLFVCTLQLPINSTLRESIRSIPMQKIKLAKMAAALKACEKLHKIGELNDYLLPRSRENGGHVSEGSWVPKKEKYEKTTSDVFQNACVKACRNCSLYLIKMLPTNIDGSNDTAIPTEARNFGILMDKKMPRIPDFLIYDKHTTMTVSLEKLSHTLHLEEAQIDKLFIFQRYLFRTVLNIEKESFTYDPQQSQLAMTIVPLIQDNVNWSRIDWTCVEEIVEKRDVTWVKPHERMNGPGVGDMFKDAVVRPMYHDLTHDNSGQSLYVIEVRDDLCPKSPFPDDSNYSTFEEYFTLKYRQNINDKTQHLLSVKHLPRNLDFLTPINSGKKLSASEKKQEATTTKKQIYLVPELCEVHVFPSSLWRIAQRLPTIIYRLDHLLIADGIRVRVIREVGKGMAVLPSSKTYPRLDQAVLTRSVNTPHDNNMDIDDDGDNNSGERNDDKHLKLKLSMRRREVEEIEKLDLFTDADESDAKYGPNPAIVLQALTTAKANDSFNLERLETMGDSFLKFAVSVALFHKYQGHHEGKLSLMRKRQIENRNLLKLGIEKGLPECMVSIKFDPRNWLPPGYVSSDKAATVREIGDKSIADCVEALIGCYLIKCGTKPCLDFMDWLGLEVCNDSDPVELMDPVFKDVPEWSQMLERLTTGMDAFEERIGYSFKNRGFLLQALTHPSYDNNRITYCYQRLEFLGDAILDYLITRFLFEDVRQYSPGSLTIIRSSLVSNNIFAKLAVKFDFHKSFKYYSPELYSMIDRFVQNQKTNNDAIEQDYDIDDGDGEDYLEINKVLGDIFESVAGAIYLDSNMSLEAVWRVYYPMMKPQIIEFTVMTPKSPVCRLLELRPRAKFTRTIDDKGKVGYMVKLPDPDGRSFSGHGSNKTIAKCDCAKRALKALSEAAA